MIKKHLILWLLLLPALTFCQKTEEDSYKIANQYLAQGNTSMAIKTVEDALKGEPRNMDLRNLLGKAYLQAGNLNKARTELLLVLNVQPRNWDAKRNIVKVEYNAQHYSAALSHINEFMAHAPWDNEMWVKKISIYENTNQWHEAQRLVDRLYAVFPSKPEVRQLYNSYKLRNASESVKGGNIYKAKADLVEILKNEPNNYDANVQLINVLLKSGNQTEALAAINNPLTIFPSDQFLITKKIGVLEELKRYPEAIQFAQLMQKKYPGSGFQKYITNLKFEAAHYSKLNGGDPYFLYLDILQSSPGNEEAQTYVINSAISKGLYGEAEGILNNALKSNPNNNYLLQRKFDVSKALNKNGQAYAVSEKLFLQNPGSSDYQEQYLDMTLVNIKGLLADEQWIEAEGLLKKISSYSYAQPLVNQYLFTVYNQQKNYAEALAVINNLIAAYPNSDTYKLNKIGLLESKGDIAAAIAATNNMPKTGKGKDAYINLSLGLVKRYIENERPDSAFTVINEILAVDAQNYQAYNYALNVLNAMKRYQESVNYANTALSYFPNDREILLKKAGNLQSLQLQRESIVILEKLHKEYPYSEKISGSLIENRLSEAKRYMFLNKPDSAMILYKLNYALDPTDTSSILHIVNIYLTANNTDSAFYYINKGLAQYPDNASLFFKKAVAFEITKNFDSSYFYMVKVRPNIKTDYGYYLQSRKLKNQAGASYFHSFYDSVFRNNSIFSAQYTRFFKNNTVTYRINFATRYLVGVALQHELDYNRKINKKTYFDANLGVSANSVFPLIKVSGSIFYTLPKEYEVEVGLKYVNLRSFFIYSLIGSLSRSFENVWINFRASGLSADNKLYNTGRLQARFFTHNHTGYFTILGGWGTPPEDRSLDFIPTNKSLGIVSRFAATGYQKEIRYKTTLGVQLTWNNIKVKEAGFINRYDLFFTMLQKF